MVFTLLYTGAYSDVPYGWRKVITMGWIGVNEDSKLWGDKTSKTLKKLRFSLHFGVAFGSP